MYEKPVGQLGIRETFILVAIYGYFTIMIVLVIPVLFIFSAAEGWTATQGIYFWIITLTTIGFGDYTPNFSQDAEKSTLVAYYRWIIIIFKFLGLAYIAFLFEIFNIGLEKVFAYNASAQVETEPNEQHELVPEPPTSPIVRKDRANADDILEFKKQNDRREFIGNYINFEDPGESET